VIPTLETERLRLRAFREQDLDAFAAIHADPEVMRVIGEGKVVDRTGASPPRAAGARSPGRSGISAPTT
jgi:RimJ/RimL family protein N-acetyltransferase